MVTYLLGEHGVLYALLDRVEELAAHADLQALRAYRDLLTEGIRSHAAVEDELLFEPLERTSPQAEAVVRGMRTMHDDGARGLGRAGSGGLPAFSRAGPRGRPTRSCAEEVRGMSRLGEAFRSHHRQLRRQLEAFAEQVAQDPQRVDVEGMVRFLREELLPHARAEEAHLYPAVEPLLRHHGDPTATMRLDHRLLEEHVRRVEAVVQEARRGGFAWPDRLRREMLGLTALLQAHLEKEERVYLPLVEGHLAEAEQDVLLTAMHEQPAAVSGAQEKVLDVRRLAPPQRHPLIFATFQALGPGEGFELVNDHDPKPLYYQFAAELPGQFTWEYLEQGPEAWRVRIGKPPA